MVASSRRSSCWQTSRCGHRPPHLVRPSAASSRCVANSDAPALIIEPASNKELVASDGTGKIRKEKPPLERSSCRHRRRVRPRVWRAATRTASRPGILLTTCSSHVRVLLRISSANLATRVAASAPRHRESWSTRRLVPRVPGRRPKRARGSWVLTPSRTLGSNRHIRWWQGQRSRRHAPQ